MGETQRALLLTCDDAESSHHSDDHRPMQPPNRQEVATVGLQVRLPDRSLIKEFPWRLSYQALEVGTEDPVAVEDETQIFHLGSHLDFHSSQSQVVPHWRRPVIC